MQGVNMNHGDFSLQLCLALFSAAAAEWCLKQTELRAGRVCCAALSWAWPGWAHFWAAAAPGILLELPKPAGNKYSEYLDESPGPGWIYSHGM